MRSSTEVQPEEFRVPKAKPWIGRFRKALIARRCAPAFACSLAGQAMAACSNPVPVPATMLPEPFSGWGPSAICAGASTGTSITSSLTTLDTAFLTQTTAFIGTPANALPDQPGGGAWIRGVGGRNTVTSTGTATSTIGGTYTADSRAQVEFGGVQGGLDLGRFNIGSSGLNLIVGVTAGLLSAEDDELAGTGIYTFNVPFAGMYAALTRGAFFADVQVRGDFYGISVTNANVGALASGLNGRGVTATGSAGYRYDIGSYFVEPSIGLIWSRVTLDQLTVPGGGPFGVPTGTFSFDAIDSLIGRLGVRVGTSLQYSNITWQPFVAASVWNEFEGDATSNFVCVGCASVLNLSTTRVGTFGQFGIGVASQVPESGFVGYARIDYRTGENIDGWSITGGLRYQFALGTPRPIVTKN